MDAAVDAGINFFDTADVYGGPQSPDMAKGYGISEEIIGRWLQRSGRRDEIVLATKVYQPMGLGPNDRRLSAYHIRRACEASLRRLQTDHIDLYQMHHVDRATPWEEIWQAMEQLVREGKISYVGSSNFAAWDVALAQSAASARHFLGPDLRAEPLQPRRAGRRAGADPRAAQPRHRPDPLQPAARRPARRRARRPRPTGALAGELQQRVEAHRDQLEAYEELCRELGAKPADVALAWLLHNPVVSDRDRRGDDESRSCRSTSARCRCSWTPKSGATRPDLARTGRSPAGLRLVGSRRPCRLADRKNTPLAPASFPNAGPSEHSLRCVGACPP